MKHMIGLKSNDNSPLQQLAIEKCDGDMDKFVEDINIFFRSVIDPLYPISDDNPFLQQQCEVPSIYHYSRKHGEEALKGERFLGWSSRCITCLDIP